MPLASLCLWLEPPCCPMPCSPNSQFNSSVSGPPSSLKHVPPPSPWASFRSGAHLCASAPIFQGAHLCASGPPLSQGSPLLRLPHYTASLLSPSRPTLSRPPTSSGPSVSISISGCWVLTSCPAHLLPPATFLGGPSFHCGEGRGPQRDCLSSKTPGEEWGQQAAVVVHVWHQPHEGSPRALTHLHSCKPAACGMLVPGTGEGR